MKNKDPGTIDSGSEHGPLFQPPAVPARATRVTKDLREEEAWSWVEPTIWTARMVQALVDGVQGGRWYSLVDKIIDPKALRAAFAIVKDRNGAAGTDHVSIQAYEARLDANLSELHDALKTGRYRPSAVRRTYIPKAGSKELRPLGIPTVRDRVVQTAVRLGLEPIFETQFSEISFGFRPRRSSKQALKRVNDLLRKGHVWTVDVDLKSYFDTVPHDRLMQLVRARMTDSKVLGLIEAMLKAPMQEAGRRWTPTKGTPQGGPLSPLLANLYLDALDHLLVKQGFAVTRYADDMVVQCEEASQAQRALEQIQQWCSQASLTLHPDKTRIVQVTTEEGFDFLGFHFQLWRKRPGWLLKYPREKSVKKLKETLRAITPRNSGDALSFLVKRANAVLRGFFNHFRASIERPFVRLDEWVRMRLRSILRKRRNGRGRGRGADHQRWPNAFFAKHGLFSLVSARAEHWTPRMG